MQPILAVAAQRNSTHMHLGGFALGFMSVLAWWSVTIDVVLRRVEHAAWATVALSGPVTVAVAIIMNQQNLMILASFLQGCWVWFLCGSALALRNGLPRRWRASLYIDILNPLLLPIVLEAWLAQGICPEHRHQQQLPRRVTCFNVWKPC